MSTKRMVIAGGTGFLGGVLTHFWSKQGYEITVLSRRPNPDASHRTIVWDGVSRGDWESCLSGADALINLCGASVNCRYHAANRQKLIDSRLLPTRILGEALSECKNPPAVWLQASTATLYRHTYTDGWNEDGEIGADPRAKDAFSVELAQAWEDEFTSALPSGMRGVLLRSAMVLGQGDDKNNVLHTLKRLTKFGLGGPMSNGRQYVSWIHEQDFCQAIDWILDHGDLSGPVNLCSPHPLPNWEMMEILRYQLKRPFGLPAPLPLLELGAFMIRTETELIIKSRRVLPGRLLKSGFSFTFPRFQDATEHLLA